MALGLFWGAEGAEAQTNLPGIDFRRSPVSTDPNASIYLEPTTTQGHLVWNVGVWGSFLNRLITLEEDAGDRAVARPVRHQVGIDTVASIGVTDRLAFGVLVPAIVWQRGDDTRVLVTDGQKLPSLALGDVALTGKVTIVRPGSLGGFSLAALGRATLPTGDTASFASEPTATGTLRLLSELSVTALSLRASAGMLYRPVTRNYVKLDMRHELPWGVGIQFRPQVLGIDDAGRQLWNLEVRGSISVYPGFMERRESQSMLGVSWRGAFGPFAVTAGVELPLSKAAGTPSVRALLGLGFSPQVHDADHDGIPDDRDECAELAEDFDGFEDSDGCPDFDNDDDGVPDDVDQCPAEKEDEDGFDDEDGCPDPDNDRDGVRDALDQCPSEPGPLIARVPGCPDPGNDAAGSPGEKDACPDVPGLQRAEPGALGCPNPDGDGDTFADSVDACPAEPENFDGRSDNDGCPEAGPAREPLARWEELEGRHLVLSERITFLNDQPTLEARSEPVLRAIASLLVKDQGVALLVGVKPDPSGNAELARSRAVEIVEALRRYSQREDAAEVVDWAAVEKSPARYHNVGFVLGTPQAKSP